jgi:hypothetical protein
MTSVARLLSIQVGKPAVHGFAGAREPLAVGDTVRVQVSQLRQPCSNISRRAAHTVRRMAQRAGSVA